MRRLTDFTLAEMRDLARAEGLQPFRGEQVWNWVMHRGEIDPSKMSDLPAPFRQTLSKTINPASPPLSWESDGIATTEKAFLRFDDNDGVEAVLIMEGERTTACLSTQIGCPVACQFCASGLFGLKRNLSRGEILDQFLAVRARARELNRRVSNIVVMGMGEPMLNYQAVVTAMEAINHPHGGAIGARHITISTVGVKKGVERLAQEGRPFTLAFSLHAPDDALRTELIPFEGSMTVAEIAEAARTYLDGTGREVTFEYVLLDGVNSEPSHARALIDLLRGVRGTVNIIPYNENPGLSFRRPAPEKTDAFVAALRRGGLKVSVRKRKGHRILAACGQLRLRERTTNSSGPD